MGDRAGPEVAQGFWPRSREPRGGRCISRARGASPSGWSPGPSRSGDNARPESSQDRPASCASTASLGSGPRPPVAPLRTAALGPTAAQSRACVQSRRTAVRSGAGHRGAWEPVRVCAWMRERGAAADSAPRLRTVARGGGGGARANSRSPRRRAAPWLIPERSVIGRRPPLCKRAKGMEFLGPGLQ